MFFSLCVVVGCSYVSCFVGFVLFVVFWFCLCLGLGVVVVVGVALTTWASCGAVFVC